MMDIPKAPATHEGLSMIGGAWNWIVFFICLVVSGGAIEYLISRRYVTRQEWKDQQDKCTQHLKDQFEIALLKNNERLEKRMIDAISKTIRSELTSNDTAARSATHSLPEMPLSNGDKSD